MRICQMRWDTFVKLEKYEFQLKLKWKEKQVKESFTHLAPADPQWPRVCGDR